MHCVLQHTVFDRIQEHSPIPCRMTTIYRLKSPMYKSGPRPTACRTSWYKSTQCSPQSQQANHAFNLSIFFHSYFIYVRIVRVHSIVLLTLHVWRQSRLLH